MRLVLSAATAAVLLAASLSASTAFPLYGDGSGPYYGPTPYYGPYGYGRPFGPRFAYGYRYGGGPYGWRRGLPNGTGYRGRGTWTGGPVGGLPNRN